MTMTVRTTTIIMVTGFCYATNEIFDFLLPTTHLINRLYYFAHIDAYVTVIDADYSYTSIHSNKKVAFCNFFIIELSIRSIILNFP